MPNNDEQGTARVLVDRFKINDPEIENAVIRGLTFSGFDVEIKPKFRKDVEYKMQVSCVIKVYKKVNAK